MSVHQLYGLKVKDPSRIVQFLSDLLGCVFQERESDFLGIYWLARTDPCVIKVISQPDPEGEYIEPEFAEFETLIYVDGESGLPHLRGEHAELLQLRS